MKNNKYWFRPKRYGFGVTPVTWEGWLITLALVVVLVAAADMFGFFHPAFVEVVDGVGFVFVAIGLAFLFLAVVRSRTDGELRWRWGDRD